MKRRLIPALLAIPLMVVVALGACGEPDGDGIATAGDEVTDGGDGAEGAEDLTEEERYEMLLDFAACMRENGVDMDDPEPGGGIRHRVDGDPAEADAAMETCRHLMPGGGQPPEPDPEQVERMLAFSQCMRDNGVPDFPDPSEGGGIHLGPDMGVDPDDPVFLAAQETCEEQFGIEGDRRESREVRP